MHRHLAYALIAGLLIGELAAAAENQVGRIAASVHDGGQFRSEGASPQDATDERPPTHEPEWSEAAEDERYEPIFDDRWGRDDRFGHDAPHPNSVRRWKR